MQKHFNPYPIYTTKCLQLLDSCSKKKNPALWLHQNKARETLFMLESIARIIYKSTNDSETKKWYKCFKELEDLLGEIDFYDEMYKNISQIKSLKKTQLDYLKRKKTKTLDKLNENLIANDFYKKFVISLNKPGKLNVDSIPFLKKLEQRIKLELLEAAQLYNEHAAGFNDMEEQVHELRRKLRWVSIYAQSLQGFIVLEKSKIKYKWEKEFVTKEVINLPYHKIPVNKELKYHVNFNITAFYAFTYVIQELGIIKDKAFTLTTLAKVIEKTTFMSKQDSLKIAQKEIKGSVSVDKLLDEAHVLLKKFFNNYDIHEVLLKV